MTLRGGAYSNGTGGGINALLATVDVLQLVNLTLVSVLFTTSRNKVVASPEGGHYLNFRYSFELNILY